MTSTTPAIPASAFAPGPGPRLRDLPVAGISSMIRELAWLSDDFAALERAIVDGAELPPHLSPALEVAADEARPPAVGDVVAFRLSNAGAYPDMETHWGGRVPLEVGGCYLGVLCQRGSTKLITAEFPPELVVGPGTELQFVAQAGGIGWATGFSPTLEQEYGRGRPSDVEILGFVRDRRTGRVLNTAERAAGEGPAVPAAELPPTVVVVGTATDVGKTTLVAALIGELSKELSCAALKGSGTGWYEDSELHARSGAFPVLNFTFAGLPTTYYADLARYVAAMHAVSGLLADPAAIPVHWLPPHERALPRRRPDVVVVEHGGDLIWASIPAYLRDPRLMAPVRAVVVCSESALGLMGALRVLEEAGVGGAGGARIYASVPLINPEGFFRRLEALLDSGVLAGIVDVNKPTLDDPREWRCAYSRSHARILSAAGLADALRPVLTQP